MFDSDSFVAECVEAANHPEPRLAVRDVLQRATSDPTAMARALPPDRAGITTLHVSPEVTVLQVVWAPGMHFGPHDHRMWAAIGIYTGGEDNAFYRRDDDTLARSGGRQLRPRDVALLGDDVIHAVTNPTTEHTGSIHVYGGDFFATERSEWRDDPYRERPYDVRTSSTTSKPPTATRPDGPTAPRRARSGRRSDHSSSRGRTPSSPIEASYRATARRASPRRPSASRARTTSSWARSSNCHSPAIGHGYVGDAIAATRTAPVATVAPQPDQAVLDAIVSALEAA